MTTFPLGLDALDKPVWDAGVRKWDERYLSIARVVATWSKDRSRQIGCVIVGPQKEIRSTGYNGFARGVDDNIEERHQRPAKYLWTEHAERNAIYNAARFGIPLDGCTIYLPWYPCVDCARAIIQCGITTVVAVEPDWQDPKYGEEFRTAAVMFAEVKMLVRYVEGAAPTQMALNGVLPDPPCRKRPEAEWCDFDKTIGRVSRGGFMGHTCKDR